MYSIVLMDGKIINVIADVVRWEEEAKMATFFNGEKMVARINMDNVAGWMQTDYKVKSEDWE